MPRTVLFIDDDRRLILVYADAITEQGMKSHCVHGPDDALAYLKAGNPADVIVWDMMMLPGKAFADMDTEGGTSTGRFLYESMRQLRPDAAFILLTNQLFDEEFVERPAERSYGRSKQDTAPDDLASFIKNL